MTPDLTPAQIERLGLLVEELGEALQMVGKAQRHGYHSTHADYGYVTNRANLAKELGHVKAATQLLTDVSDIDVNAVNEAYERKLKKYREGFAFLHHQ